MDYEYRGCLFDAVDLCCVMPLYCDYAYFVFFSLYIVIITIISNGFIDSIKLK